MKLSQFKNEEAIDVLAELMEPFATIVTDETFRGLFQNKTPNIKVVQYLLKEHKKEVIDVIAILHRTTPDKLEFNIATLTKDLVELLNDEEIMAVFRSQGQIMEASSTSATENIEA